MSISANQANGTVLTANQVVGTVLLGNHIEGNVFSARLSGSASVVTKASPTRLAYITLPASAWVGGAGNFGQIVNVEGVTEYSKVDLQPSAEQLIVFHNKDIAFTTENEDGVITVRVIGDKPTNDYTIQATITEVSV